jgi:hypothetical protein
MSSSPPNRSPLRRNTSGTKQRNQLAPPTLRRNRTAPVSRPSALRSSTRFSKILDYVDDAATSASSFLSMSLSSHSSSASRVRASISSPIEICLEEFDDFCVKVLPKHVPDKAIVGMLQYDVKQHLNHHDPVKTLNWA